MIFICDQLWRLLLYFVTTVCVNGTICCCLGNSETLHLHHWCCSFSSDLASWRYCTCISIKCECQPVCLLFNDAEMEAERWSYSAAQESTMQLRGTFEIWTLVLWTCNITAADCGDFTLFGQLKHKFKTVLSSSPFSTSASFLWEIITGSGNASPYSLSDTPSLSCSFVEHHYKQLSYYS